MEQCNIFFATNALWLEVTLAMDWQRYDFEIQQAMGCWVLGQCILLIPFNFSKHNRRFAKIIAHIAWACLCAGVTIAKILLVAFSQPYQREAEFSFVGCMLFIATVLSIVLTKSWRCTAAFVIVLLYGIAFNAVFSYGLTEVYLKASTAFQILIIIGIRVVGYAFSVLLHVILNVPRKEYEIGNRNMTGNYILHAFAVSFSSSLSRILTTQTFAYSPTTLIFFELASMIVEIGLFCLTFSMSIFNVVAKIRTKLCYSKRAQDIPDSDQAEQNEKNRLAFVKERKIKLQLIKLVLDLASLMQTPFFCLALNHILLIQISVTTLISLMALQLAFKMMNLFIILIFSSRILQDPTQVVTFARYICRQSLLFIPYAWNASILAINLCITFNTMSIPANIDLVAK